MQLKHLQRIAAGTAALHGAIAIMAGAFAAHAAPEAQADYLRTGALWQTIAALAGLYAVWRNALLAALLFVIGAALFAGALYAIAFTQIRALGVIAPFGGGAMILAWLALAWTEFRAVRKD